MLRLACPLALGVCALLATGCAGAEEERAPSRVRGSELASVREPTFLAQPPGERALLYAVERAGRIRVVGSDGTVSREPFLDVRDRVFTEGEGGMFSIAFAPDYEESGLLYLAYASRDMTLRVEEYRRGEGPQPVADPASRRTLLAIEHPNEIHWGAQLQFGPDGYLYISTGDGGPLEPIPDTAQDPNSLLGKLLRIDPSPRVGRPYTTPPDNPFAGKPGRDEVYAYGLRNPWRFSFDRETGALSIGDVGANRQEEIDYVPRGEARGANFGWPVFEGRARLRREIEAPDAVPPIFTFKHSGKPTRGLDPVCAVTGGYVVRDPDLPALRGRYLYADFCRAELRSFVPHPDGARDDGPVGLVVERIASFAEDNGGRIYALSLNGEIMRLVQRAQRR